jgi:hypothetical protein
MTRTDFDSTALTLTIARRGGHRSTPRRPCAGAPCARGDIGCGGTRPPNERQEGAETQGAALPRGTENAGRATPMPRGAPRGKRGWSPRSPGPASPPPASTFRLVRSRGGRCWSPPRHQRCPDAFSVPRGRAASSAAFTQRPPYRRRLTQGEAATFPRTVSGGQNLRRPRRIDFDASHDGMTLDPRLRRSRIRAQTGVQRILDFPKFCRFRGVRLFWEGSEI